MDEQFIAALFDAVMAAETGDSSSRINTAQDFAGSMFDPALGLLASVQGGEGIDWSQLFEYEGPEPAPVMMATRSGLDAALESEDQYERMVGDLLEANASPERVKRELRTAMGYDPGSDEDGVKLMGETLKLYDSYVDRLYQEKQDFDTAQSEYDRAMQNYDGSPKLVETELVEKFRKAGIPLPTERPSYTASDFRPGTDEDNAARDASGRAAGDAQRSRLVLLR